MAKQKSDIPQDTNIPFSEKLSAIGAEEYLTKRAKRGNVKRGWDILQKAGKGNPPIAGDELPKGWKA
jgi:hypothetical protein